MRLGVVKQASCPTVALLVVIILAVSKIQPHTCNAFTTSPTSKSGSSTTSLLKVAATKDSEDCSHQHMPRSLNSDDENVKNKSMIRRSFMAQLATAAATAAALTMPTQPALAEAETMERGGVKLTPFNSLTFNYRGGSSPSLTSDAIDEPSIPYSEFLDKLANDEVAYVEFLAPNGDAAYATFKSSSAASSDSTNTPIRIGEGYPLEDPEGWSSPAFVIKAVAKKGVPYKFVVPGLSKYN